MSRIAPLLLLLLASPLPAPLLAQVPAARLHGETEAAQTRKRLVEAQQKLTAGKTADAVDELLRVLADSGDDLVQLPDGSHQPARRLVQRVLVGLPSNALKSLRDRIDEPARKLFEAGRTARDPKPLRELLDRYFVSRSAEPALLLVGELAFERGDFAAAERHWRMLLPPIGDTALAFPQPTTDPAGVSARVLLAALFAGEVDRVTAELPAFKKNHPTAAGRLAGTDGNYADTLAKLLADPPRVPPESDGWTTLGGNPSRDGRTSNPLPRFYPNQPKWKTAIPRDRNDDDRPKPASLAPAKALAHHPVVLNGTAYLADAGRVFAFDLRTGAARVAFDVRTLPKSPSFEAAELAKPTLLNADFALTVADGKLYARLGNLVPLGTGQGEAERPRIAESLLVQLVPEKGGLKATWTAPPPAKDAAWEGASLVVDGVVLAAFTRVENSRRHLAVAAFRPPAAKPLWVSEACDVDANQTDDSPHRHELLTRAGGSVVYATHTGVTVAFEVATGRRAWAFRNPPALRTPVGGSPRDICPAVASGGRVFIAPADGDRVYGLDADTGAKLWESATAVQVEHLLGVSRNRLIAAAHGPTKGLRGYAVTDGRTDEPFGWSQAPNTNQTGPQNYGRGLLSDNLILWPTGDGSERGQLNFIDPTDGTPAQLLQPRPGSHGNLAYAEGVLLVATATELWGYRLDSSVPYPPPTFGKPLVKLEPTKFRAVELAAAARVDFDPLLAPSLPAEAKADAVELSATAWPIRPITAVPELPGLNADAPPADQRFFACDGRALFAVRPSDGKAVWRTTLEPEATFARGLVTTDGKLIAFGSDTVGCFEAKSGAEKWRFALPDFPVTSAALAGSRLVVLLGEHALIALDADTGKPAWLLDSQLRPRLTRLALDGAPKFEPHLLGTPRAVYALRTDGTRIEIDPDTGTATATQNQMLAAWSGLPAAHAGVVYLPDGPLRVTARRQQTDQPVWTRDFPGETSGTGRAPAVRVLGESLFVVVFRNYGVELHRLDLRSGKSLWANAPILTADDADLRGADVDRERLYLPVGNRLLAYELSNGREAWSRELPGGWQARVGRAGVIAYSSEPVTAEPREVLVKRLARRFLACPTGWLGVGQLATLLANEWNRTLTLVLIDADTGLVRKRWDVPASGPAVGLHLSGSLAAVASAGRVVKLGK